MADLLNRLQSGEFHRRVLIVSSHALFGEGLKSLLQQRPQADVEVVGIVTSVESAIQALSALHPDLVIVDYDDERVNREEFLARYVEGAGSLRVVLLSLQEGGSEAIVYDRRSMAAHQIDDWLKEWNYSQNPPGSRRQGSPGPLKWLGGFGKSVGNSGKNAVTRSSNMKHFFFAAVIVIVLTVLVAMGLNGAHLLPVAASQQAGPIDALFHVHFMAIAFLFSLIVGLMLYSIVVFRRRKGDDSDADHIEGNTRLEVLWTLAPLAAVIYISYLGALTLGAIGRADPKPLEVNVIASQWSWRFEYPQSGIVSNELTLPINKQVLFHLHSLDVIHSFWVPEFRVKQDVLPGGPSMIRDLRVTPDRIGDYKVRCAEMCGKLHSTMETPVHVKSQADYDAWVAQQTAAASNDPVKRGDNLSKQFGCRACHSIDGTTLVGPSWKGLSGSQVPLADGTTVTADDAYIKESILNSKAKIVKGFQPVMPDFSGQLKDNQVSDIIAFIKSLK